MEQYGTPLPARARVDPPQQGGHQGPITTPIGGGFRSVNVAIRKELDLYTCLRPAFSIAGSGARYDDIDIVIVRENTEDLYAGIEFEEGSEAAAELIAFAAEKGAGVIKPDSGISLKPISISATQRIVRYAFDYAHRERPQEGHRGAQGQHPEDVGRAVPEGRAREVAAEYADSGIVFEDYIVDATCMQLVLHPEWWDVLVLPNLYGDIISDLAAGLIGGLGIAPGANIGADYAVFEPTHGSAPKYAGKDMANPTAEILSATLMLRHLGEVPAADRILAAVRTVIGKGEKVTYDIRRSVTGSTDGAVGTQAYADALIAEL